MEMMHESWLSIMYMPYRFFMDTLQWKIDLEEEKKKRLEEQTKGDRITGHSTPRHLKKG